MCGAPGRIRTYDPLVRSQVLYPAELRVLNNVYYRNREERIITEMIQINTFADAHAALQPYVLALPPAHQAYSLTRMRKLMKALKNPQDRLRVIHVAGTSGKTSTSYYVAAMLAQTGRRVGLTVSPHLMEVNERLQIDLLPLPEATYAATLDEFLSLIEPLAVKPTYFELLIAMAYWYFAREAVDYAVIEVGLGGLLDSTNVCHRSDKICVITDIGLDHQTILGNSLASISQQKAGIIQPHNEVFCYRQAPEVLDAIFDRATTQKANLHVYDYSQMAQTSPAMPSFQQRNWQLAAHVFDGIRQRDNLPELSYERWEKTKKTYIPGRMEVVLYQGRTLILDGAHNPQKMQALLASIKVMYGSSPIAVLAAFKDSKDSEACLRLLARQANKIVLTQLSEESVPKLPIFGGNILVTLGIPRAFEQLLSSPETLLVVTGTFKLVQAVKQLI